jgi:voltage-gated sodium channel
MISMNLLQHKFEVIRSNKTFELFVVGIIVFSAVMIGAKTYDVPPAVTRIVVWLDWFITLFFMVEITIRFLGEKRKRDFFKHAWNIFDTVIVTVSLIPIEDSELAIVGRLIRIFRVLRMISIIPELRMLLNSLIKAMPRLGYVALLMFIIFYMYAAVGATFFKEINPVLWGDISISLLTLFRVMTFEDWTDVMYETMAVYGYSWIFYISFIFFTAFAFLNMIIGIVVNVLEEEQKEQSRLDGDITLEDVHQELLAVRALLEKSTTS